MARTDLNVGPKTTGTRASAFGWILVTEATAWAVAATGSGSLHLSRELFVLLYAATTGAVALAYVRSRHVDLARSLRQHPTATVLATAVATALAARSVLLQPGAEASTGARLAFELFWSGVVYGAADAVLLTIVPMLAAFDLFEDAPRGRVARIEQAAVAILASLVVYAAYHVGFAEFRGPTLVWPLVSGLVMGLAYAACKNPIAPIVAHAAMHVAAVLHGPAGTMQLPPHY